MLSIRNTLRRIEQYMQVGILQVLLPAAVDRGYEKFDWNREFGRGRSYGSVHPADLACPRQNEC